MRIGVLVNNIDGRYQTHIIRGIKDFSLRYGVQPVIFSGRSVQSPYPDDALHNRIYGQALSLNLDGYLVVAGALGTNCDDAALAQWLGPFQSRPLVTLGRRLPGIPGVASDDVPGLAEALDHLAADHGCRRIAFLSGPAHDPASRIRFEAYRAGLERHGMVLRKELVFWGDYSFQCCPEAAREMLKGGDLPFDALVCANDEMAIGVQQHLALAGFRAPQDYALAGFDDLPAFSLRSPGLTTVRQPLYEQTMAAGTHLVHQIRGISPPPLADLPSGFVRRETCGCSPIPVVNNRRTQASEEASSASWEPGPFLEEFFRTSTVSPAVRQEVEQLVPTLLGAVALDLRTQRESPLFLQSLNEWLEITFPWERYAETWQALFLPLHRRLAQGTYPGREGRYRADLLQTAQTLLARRTDQKQARVLAQASDVNAQLRWFSRQLSQSQGEAEILPLVRAGVGVLGITGAALEVPWPEAGRNDELVFLPLVSQGRWFGTLALTGPGLDPVIYATIQEEVAQAFFLCSLVTERQAGEDQKQRALDDLRRSEERYRDMAQMVPMLMWETDSRLSVTYGNRAAEVSLGLTPGESLRPRLAPADRTKLDGILTRLSEVAELPHPGIRVTGPGGQGSLLVVQLSVIRSADGNLGLRWHALDPLPVALESTLPDAAFLEAHRISEREREVLILILYGLRSREIAERLTIAESTVKGHIGRIFDKFGVDNRAALLDLVQDHQTARHGHGHYLLMVLNRLLAGDTRN